MYFKQGLRILGFTSFIFLQYLNFVSSTNQNCPLYWSAYANVCYRFRWVNLKSWNEAKAWCASQGGDLLKLENNAEKTYITNAIKNIVQHQHLRNTKWWTGMNNKNPQSQAWVWGDKSPVAQVITSAAHLHQSTTDHCVYISGTAGMVNTQCWQKYAYICERARGTPLTCDSTRGWQQFNNFCYQVHPTDVQTWSGAVNVCSRNGGDLVEIDNDQDQIAIHDFARNTKRPLWTALHSVQMGNTNNWQWLNGTVMTSNRALQYWANGQPPVLRTNMLNRTCVWMNNGQQDYRKSWSTDNCNVRKGFVCKRPEGVCMPGWVPHQKLCFLFNIRFKYNWYQANTFCRSSGGNLVSIYGTTFTNFINSYLDELQSAGIDSFWIGLTDNNKTGGPWMWTNGGNIQHYQHWPGNHAARNTPNRQDCGYIYTGDRSGSWRTTNNCVTQKAFVCQIPMGKRVNPVTTPRPQFKCTGHWLLYNGNCYQFNDTRLSWLNARQACQNAGADLVTINSAAVQSYILRQSHGKEYWIGLNDRTQEGRWQWLDATTGSKYYNWNSHEPNNLGTENCVEMNFMNRQGKWNDRQCSTLVRFICQKTASNAQLPVSVSTTAAMPISVRCGLNWEEDPNSNNCYQFFDKQLDWMDAREVCRNNGGDLASIESRVEQAYIAGKINNMNSIALWIGINDRATENKFIWVDGSPVAYLHWANGEPNNYRNRNEDCGNIYTSTSYWNDSPCSGRNGFICKKQSSQRTTTTPPPPVVTKNGYVMGCQDGYKPFQGNCYHLWQIRQNWAAAKSFCHRQGSFLATINSREEQNFVMTMIPKRGYGYWIGLNDLANQMTFFWSDGSPVLYTNWAVREPNNYGHKNEDCVLMLSTNGQWNDAICQNPADGFICKKPMTLMSATPKPESVGCTWPAYGYGSYCYRFVYQTKTWQDAQKVCVNAFQGTLAAINDRFTEAFLSAYMSYQTDYFWIGLSDTQTQGTYKWISGVPVTYSNWVATHTGNEIASCVALTSRHPKGLWQNLNCTDQHHFICQLPRQGYTTPALTQPPANLPCPGGYSSYQSYCYQAVGLTDNTQWMSFNQARDYCRGYGGDLASVHSAGENSFIQTLTQSGSVNSWIGLNDRDIESGHKWTDGSATDYTQWNRGEPNNFADTEDCVELTRGSGGWNDVNCFFSKPLVCKVAKGVQLSTTAALPTASSSGACGTGWVLYNQFCYYTGNGSTLLTWFDARSTCNQMGAELASIHSQDEDNMLVGQYTRTKRTVDYWIGLNDIEYNSKYVWTDGSLLDFVSWSPHEPNDYGGGENCVTMPYWTGGKWNDDNCNMKKNFICKRPVTGSTKPINPGTTAVIAAGCPNSNFKPVPHSNRCYFIVQNKVNWTSAVSACQTAYPGASLATISSLQEQLFLNSMLYDKDPRLTLWIGLNDLRQSRRFYWADNSPLTFVNWYKGEPNNAPDGSNVKWNSERCVEMYASSSAAGQWNDKQCGALRNFVCQQHRQSGVAVTSVQGACPSGFSAFGASCYRYFPPNGAAGSWAQAQQVCQQNSAQLVVMSSVYEDGFVQSLAGDLAPNGYWIGMADKTSSGTYTWVQSGWPVTYTNWGAGEPTKGAGEGCVAIMNHKWNDTQCNQQLGFVCHINNNTPLPTPPQSSLSCDGSAPIAVGEGCYYISGFKTKTWPEASYMCERMGMELASFHSLAEMNVILQRFQNYQAQPGETAPRFAENIWLGMTKGFSDGFQWKDGSAVNFLNWDKGEPSDAMSSSQEECVEMYTNSGKWNDVTCFTKRRYVCKKAAQMSTVGFKLTSGNLPPLNPNPGTTGYNPWASLPTTNFPTNRITPSRQTLQPLTQPQGVGNPKAAPQQQTSTSSSGLSAGGLAGLLVAIIFILGLFAFGIIFLKRRQFPAGSAGQGVGGFENAMYYSSEGAVNMKNKSKEEDA
ncbi:macrophage mannose receptor 1-like [Saccostrea echinata]|uniref:macrophage mannose receptor 1-like n=1 Tax=Saccostrea echinata TaxID=191078 RepID=UPI002A81B881|nr:macrophage mannose receptor 1-like [Saccostrea echinata]